MQVTETVGLKLYDVILLASKVYSFIQNIHSIDFVLTEIHNS